MEPDLRSIGYITKTHALKGALSGKLSEEFILKEDFQLEEPVYVEIDGNPVPFFMEFFHEDEDRFRLKFDHIHSIEEAQAFIGRSLLVNSQFVEALDFSFEFEGFQLLNQNQEHIGIIKALEQISMSELLEVESKDGISILIPFNDELIIEVNEQKRQIQMEIAEGLTDI